jgi:hypothetical protein
MHRREWSYASGGSFESVRDALRDLLIELHERFRGSLSLRDAREDPNIPVTVR